MHKLEYFTIAKKIIKSFQPSTGLVIESTESGKKVFDEFANYRKEIT